MKLVDDMLELFWVESDICEPGLNFFIKHYGSYLKAMTHERYFFCWEN